MRQLALLVPALALISGASAQVNVGGPTEVQDPAYPLKVRIMERNTDRSRFGVRSWGRADLYDGPKVRGFDYQTDCNVIVMTSQGDERFSARWKKQDKELEMLVSKIGAAKPQRCVVKANLQPFVYEFEGGAIVTEPPPDAPEAPAETQAAATGSPHIAIEGWTKPAPGWLYVLDPKPNPGAPGGRIWLLDPQTAKVMGSIRTGDNADFALAPDGSRLYVASVTDGATSELAVIDTAQGMVLETGTIEDRAVANALPAFSTMAVSDDGLVLRILIVTRASSDADAFLLAAFNTQTGDFLPESVHLGNCGPGRFISYPTANQFDFLCPRTNKVRLIKVDADSRELRNSDITLPWERRIGVAVATEVPGGQDIGIVRGDGAVVAMNIETQGFADTAARPELPDRVLPAAWPSSPDGSKVYLGYNKYYERAYDNRFYLDYGRPPNVRPANATAGEFRVFDTRTWRRIGNIGTSVPFWSAVAGRDGKMLYAMAPQRHSVLVIDTTTMRETRTIKVGGAPALALVAP